MWENAECRGMDTGDFIGCADNFPDPADPSLAIATCSICAIRVACLDFAIETGQVGVWGGTTTKQRKRIAKSKTKVKVRWA